MLVIEFFQVVEFLIKGILFVLGILLNHIDAVVYQFGYCIFSGLFGIFLNFLNGLGVSLPLTLQFLDIVIGVVKTLRSCSSNFFLDILHGFNETVIDGYSEFIFKNRFGAVVSAHCINRAIERICRDYNKEEKEKVSLFKKIFKKDSKKDIINSAKKEAHEKALKEEIIIKNDFQKDIQFDEDAYVSLRHIDKIYDNKVQAVFDFNLDIQKQEFIVLVGPSGCGKTTTLRMIAGLETPTSGKITINGEVVFDSETGVNVPASKRHVGFLFQNYALWPHMTVYKNICFGLQNINEKTPLRASLYIKYIRLSEIVLSYQLIEKLVNQSINKKGGIDKNRAIIALIDEFEISSFAAKELFEIHFEKLLSDKEKEAIEIYNV